MEDRANGGTIVIQYNWEENHRCREKIWAYFKRLNKNSEHGCVGDAIFDKVSQSSQSILIHHIPTHKQTLFVHPLKVFSTTHQKSIISLDVAAGGLGVSVSTDNKLHLWDSQNGTVRRVFEGHLFDVYTCKFFPSGIVVLTGGADMQLKIWDAVTGVCATTLTGHVATITDTCIVERGKNIISVSKDACAKLWSCGQSSCLATVAKADSPINCCDIIHLENEADISSTDEMGEEWEIGTKGKILAFGCENGKVYLTNVFGRLTTAIHSLSCAISSICWLPTFHLIMGLEDGRVMILNGKKMQEPPELLCHDSASEVLCMKPLEKYGFILGRKDGLCQFYRFDGTNTVQLTGPDCDPVYSIASDSHYVYTACRDSVIRKYRISDMRLNEYS